MVKQSQWPNPLNSGSRVADGESFRKQGVLDGYYSGYSSPNVQVYEHSCIHGNRKDEFAVPV
jgi:hypothetical protein